MVEQVDEGWYYIRKGVLEDETVGPISESALFTRIFDNKIKGDTLLAHSKITQGQWIRLGEIQDGGFTSRWHDYRNARQRKIDEAKAHARAVREAEVEAKAHAKAERKRIAAAEAEARAKEDAAAAHVRAQAAAEERARRRAARTWEYWTKTVTVDTDFSALLNDADEKGWEYVRMDHFSRMENPGCIFLGSPTVYHIDVAVFRRPI